ncbi:MAG: hypothetical protein KC609_20650 [Myxococcales bacterium]|nr:hypothetical protein [Myxococcales bacterium]
MAAGFQDPQDFQELGLALALPDGWEKHPKEYLWRPNEDDGESIPPTLAIEVFTDGKSATFVPALKTNLGEVDDIVVLEDEEVKVGGEKGLLVSFRTTETQYLFNQVVVDRPNGGVASIVFYAPEKAFRGVRRQFLKVVRSVKWLS